MELEDFAKRIRDACLEALLQAYEDAGVQGLCAEGRWEAAVGALKTVELAPLLREFNTVSRLIDPCSACSWLVRGGRKRGRESFHFRFGRPGRMHCRFKPKLFGAVDRGRAAALREGLLWERMT